MMRGVENFSGTWVGRGQLRSLVSVSPCGRANAGTGRQGETCFLDLLEVKRQGLKVWRTRPFGRSARDGLRHV